jgi:hypothetical protein
MSINDVTVLFEQLRSTFMKRDAEYLKTLAQQVEDSLITLAEAMDLIACNEKLTDEQQTAVDQAVMDCRHHGSIANNRRSPCGGEAYAYPHARGGTSWGFNAGDTGFCVARGVRD